jgi:hypothetical protein
MTFEFLVLIALFLILIGVLPWWPYSRWWGYGPAVVVAIIFLVLAAMGRIPSR